MISAVKGECNLAMLAMVTNGPFSELRPHGVLLLAHSMPNPSFDPRSQPRLTRKIAFGIAGKEGVHWAIMAKGIKSKHSFLS